MSISPNVPEPGKETYVYETPGTPRWIIVVFVLVFALIGYVVYAGYAARTKLQADLAQANSKQTVLSAEVDQTNSRLAELRGQLEVTTQKLGFTQAELARARALAQNIRQQQQQSDARLAAQIGQVQQDAAAKIGQVSTDLSGAKSDINATKQDLEATKSKLTSTIGDLGVQSGLIARNQSELEELKRLGERNIYEIHLDKSKRFEHIGPILLRLTHTNPKKYQYTMLVTVNDKTIEKKNRTADEPVQFYVRGEAFPYQIVIFDVLKDKVNGYLSTPKEVATNTHAQ